MVEPPGEQICANWELDIFSNISVIFLPNKTKNKGKKNCSRTILTTCWTEKQTFFLGWPEVVNPTTAVAAAERSCRRRVRGVKDAQLASTIYTPSTRRLAMYNNTTITTCQWRVVTAVRGAARYIQDVTSGHRASILRTNYNSLQTTSTIHNALILQLRERV